MIFAAQSKGEQFPFAFSYVLLRSFLLDLPLWNQCAWFYDITLSFKCNIYVVYERQWRQNNADVTFTSYTFRDGSFGHLSCSGYPILSLKKTSYCFRKHFISDVEFIKLELFVERNF